MLQYRLQPVGNFRCDYATGADFCDAFVTSTESSYPRLADTFGGAPFVPKGRPGIYSHCIEGTLVVVHSARLGNYAARAPEYSRVKYVNRHINSTLMCGFRSDFLDDRKGQRTGFATKYTDNTFYV